MYANSWLRDLPLLDIGQGVYLWERILLGTYQVELDQKYIRVGPIPIDEYTTLDQACKIGLNKSIDAYCQFGISNKIGLNVYIGDFVRTVADVTIGHKTNIGSHLLIHDNCFIGSFSIVTAEGQIISRKTKRGKNLQI